MSEVIRGVGQRVHNFGRLGTSDVDISDLRRRVDDCCSVSETKCVLGLSPISVISRLLFLLPCSCQHERINHKPIQVKSTGS